MLKNPELVKNFENSLLRRTHPDYFRNLQIFEALYQEARSLGVFPLKDPLEGIEIDIRLAKVINVRTSASKDRDGTQQG